MNRRWITSSPGRANLGTDTRQRPDVIKREGANGLPTVSGNWRMGRGVKEARKRIRDTSTSQTRGRDGGIDRDITNVKADWIKKTGSRERDTHIR